MRNIVQKYWPIFAIGILWVVFSASYFIKGLVPFPSSYLISSFPPWNAHTGVPVKNNAMPDIISQIYPWKVLTVDSWKKGVIPLWNPYSFAGTGHAANYQTAIFSPLTLLFFVLPFIDAWSLLILLQPLVAGLGMYLFLRERNSSARVGSFIGAVAFMFCGFMVGWMAYGTLGWSAAMLPWILFFISRYVSKHIWYAPILASLSIAASFVSGHFQISVYVLGLSLLYTIFISVRYKRITDGFILLLYILFGLAIAAPQLLLTYHAYQQSVRSTSFIKGEVIPWNYIVSLFAPDFYGNPVTRNDWFGHYAEWASYIGIIPLILALLSFAYKRTKEQLFFMCVAIITMILAYQSPLSDLLFFLKIPALSTSAASRILILTSFSLSFLSAVGWSHIQDIWVSKNRKLFFIYSACILSIVLIIWGIVLGLRPFDIEKLSVAKRNLVLPTGLTLLSLILMVAGFMKSKMMKSVVILLILFGVVFDLYRFSSKWMPFESRSDIYPPVASLEYLRAHAGPNRVFGNIGGEVASTFGISLIEGYDAMYQKRYGEFMQAASKKLPLPPERSVVQFDKNGVHRDTVLQLLGVKYIYHRKSDGQAVWAFPFWEYEKAGSMKQVYADDDYWIYEYTDAFPRAFLAGNYVVKQSDRELLSELFSDRVNLRDTVLLEEEPSVKPQEGSASAEIVSYTPNRVEIKTTADSPKLLFLSDTYDSGWSARLDGVNPTRIFRADYDFRAVEVPAGVHTVEFIYRPSSVLFGFWISIASLISIILSTISSYLYEHRHR